MNRDWLLTLLAMSPYFLAATIVVLAVIPKARYTRDTTAKGAKPMNQMHQLRGRRSRAVKAMVALALLALMAVGMLTSAQAQVATPSAQAQDGAAISIANFAFQPDSLQVATGTTVTWTNADSTAHTVTADDGAFDAGPLAPGASFTQTFTTPGTYTYHCQIHPFMTGTIVVS